MRADANIGKPGTESSRMGYPPQGSGVDTVAMRETRDYVRTLSESSSRLEAAFDRLHRWTRALVGLTIVLAFLTAILAFRSV